MILSLKNIFTGITRNTVFLAFSSMFSDIATEMLYPLYPIFLTQTLQASGSIIGFIDGLGQATQSIMQGFSGWLSDKVQKYKLIALCGYFLAALAKPLMGLSTIWLGVLAARFLDRLGTGIRSAPRDALVASSTTQQYRGKAFGLESVGDNFGAFIGPMLAICLLLLFHLKIRTIFYLTIIPGLLAFFMVAFVKERPIEVTAKISLDKNLNYLPKIYWQYLLITALFGIGNSSNVFLILQTQQIGASLIKTILTYAGFNLVAALISYPAGFLSDIVGRKIILVFGFIIFTVSYLGFGITHNISVLILLFIFYGMFQGIFRAVGKAMAIDLVPHHLQASGAGMYMATVGILQLFASIVAGLLWDHVGHNAIFYYGAVFGVVGSTGLILFRVPHGASA